MLSPSGSAQLPVGLAVFELPDGDPRVLFINAEFLTALRLTDPPKHSNALVDVFPGNRYVAVRDAIGHVRTTAQGRALIWSSTTGQDIGTESRISLEVYPVAIAGGRAGYALAVARPAESSAPGLEAQVSHLRVQADHLAETERAKSEFLTLASHELRGPITLLRGYVAMLSDGSLGALPPSAAGIMPLLEARIRQLDQLAREMTEISRLDGEQNRAQPTRVDLQATVTRAIAGFQPAAPNHRIVYDDGGSTVEVRADLRRVEIIVANLLDNAIKYSPAGGEISCRISASGGFGILVLSDHGIGIAADDMRRLFSRFSRFASTERSDIPGTGLGLYLSRELARLDGGDITAVSHLHEGSEFRLSLPMFPTPERLH